MVGAVAQALQGGRPEELTQLPAYRGDKVDGGGVPQDMREMLVGHASNTVHGQVYVLERELRAYDLPDSLVFIDQSCDEVAEEIVREVQTTQ